MCVCARVCVRVYARGCVRMGVDTRSLAQIIHAKEQCLPRTPLLLVVETHP